MKSLPLPERGHVTVWDRPLGVRVAATGVKTYIVMLGSGRRHAIGRVGEISLKDARTAALRLKAEHRSRPGLPASVSLESARREYMAALAVRPNTRMYYERNLNRLPATRLRDIAAADINRILDALGKPSRVQALRTYTAFFAWCIRRHYLDQSPCARMQGETSPSRSRVLSDEELVRIWRACEQRGELGADARSPQGDPSVRLGAAKATQPPSLPATFARIVQLLILTGQRRNEIASLQTSWIKDNTITLPSEVTKNGREHAFPVAHIVASVLKSVTKTESTHFLFPARGTSSTCFNGWSKSKAALDKASGVTDWTLHDLRRTYATNMARLGLPIHVIEKLLNHVSGTFGGIVGVYQRHQFMPEMREAVQKYEKCLEQTVNMAHHE